MFEIKGKYATAKVFTDNIDDKCYSQIINFVNHPAFINEICIMPDTHAGIGSVIGFTMRLTDKVIPNVIGVDIGCGIQSVFLNEDIDSKSLPVIDQKIRELIPFGFDIRKEPLEEIEWFPFEKVKETAIKFAKNYDTLFKKDIREFIPDYSMEYFENKCKEIGIDFKKALCSLGTLGGGNHFIEIGKTQLNRYVCTVHTGSRNFGLKIANYWQKKAELQIDKTKEMESAIKEMIELKKKEGKQIEIPDEIKRLKQEYLKGMYKTKKELRYLENEDAYGYLFDMIFAQEYASFNRSIIRNLIVENIFNEKYIVWPYLLDTVHNYIDVRDMIIRKGAISSYSYDTVVIPFNMRDGLIIGSGKSNKEWNFSAPHGAGRLMSRSQAKEKLDLEKYKSQMEGIFSTSICDNTLDESPDAYKDTELIKELIKPTIDIRYTIKPVLNLKAGGYDEK